MVKIKIKKYQLIKLLEIAKEHYGLNTIDELIEDINKQLINDDDIAATFEEQPVAKKTIKKNNK